MSTIKYKRVILKLSGEALGAGGGINPSSLNLVVTELKQLIKIGAEVAVVVGAGNIWRKRSHGQGIGEVAADYMGMLGTVLNGLALQDALGQKKIKSLLQSPIAYDLPGVNEIDYVKANKALLKGWLVIFAGGTGKPYVTTDTAAAERAVGVRAQLIIKAGPADGVYSADPRKYSGAKKYKLLTLNKALQQKIKVMDRQAFSLCFKNHIPIVVCRWRRGVLSKIVRGQAEGTLITT